jgi:UDP-4-amino-4,6-dideoxy-N-acetyl-beta-L-altrosamine transaminase
VYIPYGRQSINFADIFTISAAMRDEFLTQGPRVVEFESAMSKRFDASHAVAVNSATSALHLACLALDVGVGDIVWTSAITFVASANCAKYCGADVDFVDIDPKTYNMSVAALELKLEAAAQAGRLPKVVIPVHLTGQPSDMAKIRELSNKFGFYVIEDASHATGASYLENPIGSCVYSDITVFSFHPVKILTTGEGGAALTNSGTLAQKMIQLRSHGITRDPKSFIYQSEPTFHYEQHDLGFNYRLTDFQAALGLSQLKRLDNFLKRRRQIAAVYNEKLANLNLEIPFQDTNSNSSWHLYVVRVGERDNPYIRNNIFEQLRQMNIGVNLHYIPVYRHPYYAKLGYDPKSFPEAEAYYSQAISLPIHFELTVSEQNLVIRSLAKLGL